MPNPRAIPWQADAGTSNEARPVFERFRRPGARAVIDRLHGEIMAAARQPAIYRDYAVADTVDGRFEALALMAGLALRRLSALPAPGPVIAQDLLDEIFSRLDANLREMGVGDVTVPKRMQKFASALLGRRKAYEAALDAGDAEALAAALARNLYAGRFAGDDDAPRRCAAYVEQIDRSLARRCDRCVRDRPRALSPAAPAGELSMTQEPAAAPVFSRSFAVEEALDAPLHATIEAAAHERAALAAALGLEALHAFKVDVVLTARAAVASTPRERSRRKSPRSASSASIRSTATSRRALRPCSRRRRCAEPVGVAPRRSTIRRRTQTMKPTRSSTAASTLARWRPSFWRSRSIPIPASRASLSNPRSPIPIRRPFAALARLKEDKGDA